MLEDLERHLKLAVATEVAVSARGAGLGTPALRCAECGGAAAAAPPRPPPLLLLLLETVAAAAAGDGGGAVSLRQHLYFCR